MVTVIPREEAVLQHLPQVCDVMIDMPPQIRCNNSLPDQKFGNPEILKRAADSRKSSRHISPFRICLFDYLRPSQQSFSYVETGLPGLNQYQARINCLAQGHNAVTLMGLEPSPL